MFNSRKKRSSVIFVIFAVIVFGSNLFSLRQKHHSYGFQTKPPLTALTHHAAPIFESQFVSPEGLANFVHAASVTQMSNGLLRAAWYAGSRDGAKDLTIYSSVFNPNSEVWSSPTVISTRAETQTELGMKVKKLGNPVIWTDDAGQLWLFYVTVVWGGWSFSNINYKISNDNGKTWSNAKKLFANPFFNYGTLVKSKPYQLADGAIMLPIYQEFIGKMSEILVLDRAANILSKKRLSKHRLTIQPDVVPLSKQKAVVTMRRSLDTFPSLMLVSTTADGGRTWSQVKEADIPNPNAAVTSAALDDNVIVVFNNHQQGRNDLSLAYSRDDSAQRWHVIHEIEQDPEGYYAYPFMIKTNHDEYHLLYTWNKKRIKHVRFNRAWVQAQLQYQLTQHK